MFGLMRGAKISWHRRRERCSAATRRPDHFWLPPLVVVAWWLTIAAIVVATVPRPVVSAPRGGPIVAGQVARINLPGLPSLPIPVSRVAFDELRLAYRESDEDAIERASRATAWLDVSHGQAVRVEMVDGGAVEVTVLEGKSTGRQGWMLTRQLSH